MHIHIWRWRPTTPGIVSIRSQFLLVQWVDLPSLIHLCVGARLKSVFPFQSPLVHSSVQPASLSTPNYIVDVSAGCLLSSDQNAAKHSPRTALCQRSFNLEKKDWWKLDMEGMLPILQPSFTFNFTDKHNLKNLDSFSSTSCWMTKSGL